MQDIPRQLLYQDKKGYGEIFNNDPTGVNNFLVQICQMLISKCNLNGSCVDLVKIINESFYYSIKINQQPGVFSDDVNEVLKSELMEHVGSQEIVLITKVLIYLLLSLSNDASEESQKVLEELGKKLKREVPSYSDFSAYGFFEWVKTERKKVSFTVDLSPRPRRVSELEDHEIYELTDQFTISKIQYVLDLYESEEDKADAVAAIDACVERYKTKLDLPERSYSEINAFLHNINKVEVKEEQLYEHDSNAILEEQSRIIEDLKTQLSNKDALLESKDKTIGSLRNRVSELESDAEMYRSSLHESEENYKQLTEQTADINEAYCILLDLAKKHNLYKMELDVSCPEKDDQPQSHTERVVSLLRLADVAAHCGNRDLANQFDLLIRKALNEDITREDIRILNTIDAAYAGEKQEEKDDKRQAAEAIREIASRPTTQNTFTKDSVHLGAGSTMNGDVITKEL